MKSRLDKFAEKIRACRLCVDDPVGRPLPHEPRPVLRVSQSARLVIVGQAPGTRVHASGVPFSDASGDRLRAWMGVTAQEFYDTASVAIVPMGFCFPGLDAKGGDMPPRRECATHWRSRLFKLMPQAELIVLVGLYAQKWHLGANARQSLTETVEDWRAIIAGSAKPKYFPVPHPSWRNNAWLTAHPWFERDLLPRLRTEVRKSLTEQARLAG
jgi:uracil-DNA glycosylase